MELGKRIAGRYRAAARRKPPALSCAGMSGDVLNRYGRRLLALRPLSLLFMKQAAAGGRQAGVQHLHLHQQFNLQWHERVEQLLSMAAGTVQRQRQAEGARQVSSGAGERLVVPSEKTVWKERFAPATDFPGTMPLVRFPETVLRQIQKSGTPDIRPAAQSGLARLHLRRHNVDVDKTLSPSRSRHSGEKEFAAGKFSLASFSTGVLSRNIRVDSSFRVAGTMVPLPVVKQTMTTAGLSREIRLLQTSTLHRESTLRPSPSYAGTARIDGASPTLLAQSAMGNEQANTTLVRTKTGNDAVQMVVKREAMNPAVGDVSGQGAPVQGAVISQSATAAQAATSAAPVTQEIQPKIDVNRLTDDVYRMLERRLITERERRGR
ncbi:MAG: hypothetical protein OEV28_06625 [Nitrospirota bacterium]|nr:hypothetical protein [Nitrospirota bacterium]